MPRSVGSNIKKARLAKIYPVNTRVCLANKPENISMLESNDDSSKDWNFLKNSYFINFHLEMVCVFVQLK